MRRRSLSGGAEGRHLFVFAKGRRRKFCVFFVLFVFFVFFGGRDFEELKKTSPILTLTPTLRIRVRVGIRDAFLEVCLFALFFCFFFFYVLPFCVWVKRRFIASPVSFFFF